MLDLAAPFGDYAKLCEAVAATSKRNEKIGLVADYLRGVAEPWLGTAAVFAAGRALPVRKGALKLGGSLAIDAARESFHFDARALQEAYDRHGDLGSALSDLAQAGTRPGLFSRPLSIDRVATTFAEIAAVKGAGASRRRSALLAALLADATPIECKYLIKLVTGDLRIGLKEALVVDALALAFALPAENVRRALLSLGDIGAVAELARQNRLDAAGVRYGVPIKFMLASPLRYGSDYKELEAPAYLAEDKFDGIRVQAHCRAEAVRLFSRRMNDVSGSYPEIVSALQAHPDDAILDAELVAYRDGRALPFQALQGRLQRKTVAEELLQGVPLALLVFDVLASGDAFLLDLPLAERRARLEDWSNRLPAESRNVILPARGSIVSMERADGSNVIEALFAQARSRGNEGLMLKALDSRYAPGRRGRWWFKLKRELATLDCVVVAVEYGHGKRNAVLSDYTFAVRDGDRLLTIGKAYSGLTDAEIAGMTQWFLDHAVERHGRWLRVEPQVVVEIAFDVLQKSDLHDSGYAMRFPRIVRLRPDKTAADASTLEEAKALAEVA